MHKFSKVNHRTWIDENNIIYRRSGRTKIETSDGRILRTPRMGEKIFLDGQGNGFLFV